jgi:hypothetical protein
LLSTVIKNDKLIKVEDGICDYLGFQFYAKLPIYKEVIRKAYIYLNDADFFYSRSSVLKPSDCYFFFPEKKPFDNSINLFDYKDKVLEIIRNFQTEKSCSISGGILLVAQTLYEDGNCKLDDEVNLYIKVVNYFKSKGENKIVIKLHPRTSKEKTTLLNNKVRKLCNVNIENSEVIVERLMIDSQFSVIVGMWSNPIILSRKLFNCNSYSLLPYLVENKDKFKVSQQLCKTHEILKTQFPFV